MHDSWNCVDSCCMPVGIQYDQPPTLPPPHTTFMEACRWHAMVLIRAHADGGHGSTLKLSSCEDAL